MQKSLVVSVAWSTHLVLTMRYERSLYFQCTYLLVPYFAFAARTRNILQFLNSPKFVCQLTEHQLPLPVIANMKFLLKERDSYHLHFKINKCSSFVLSGAETHFSYRHILI
jgi:hypothetical protein